MKYPKYRSISFLVLQAIFYANGKATVGSIVNDIKSTPRGVEAVLTSYKVDRGADLLSLPAYLEEFFSDAEIVAKMRRASPIKSEPESSTHQDAVLPRFMNIWTAPLSTDAAVRRRMGAA